MTAILPSVRKSTSTTKKQTTGTAAGKLNAALLAVCAAMTTPPPPEPDWDAFREGLRTQNGYQQYFAQAAQQQLLTAASLPVDFYDFRKNGNYGPFLTLLSQVFSLLPLQDRIHGLTEMIQLSQTCHLPQAFIDELIHLAQSPSP